MDLNGQRLGCVEKLKEQRKLTAGSVSTKKLTRMLTDQFVQQAPVERTANDSALLFAEIDDFPTLGPPRCVRVWFTPLLG